MGATARRKSLSARRTAVRVSITFPKSQYDLLERISRDKKVSTAWVVREAVDRYMEQLWPLLRSE